MLQVMPEAIARIVRPFLTEAGRDAARRLAWLTLWTLGSHACGLLSLMLLTATLPVGDFGKLIFALTAQSYLAIVGLGGAYTIAMRDACRQPESLPRLIGAYWCLTAGLSAGAGLIAWLVAWIAGCERDELTILGLMTLGNIAVCMTLRPFYDARHQQPRSALLTLAGELIALGFLAILCWLQIASLSAIGLVYVAKWCGISLAHACAIRWTARASFRTSANRAVSMIRESWPLMFGAILRLLPLSGGILVVRAFHGDEEVAVMGVLQQVVLAYVMLATLGNRIVEPYIAGILGLRPDFVLKLGIFVLTFLTALLVVVATAGIFATEVLLPPTYSGVWNVMVVLLSAAMLDALSMFGRMYLIVLHRERVYLVALGMSAIAFLAMACVWVPTSPLLGSAIATLSATTIGTAGIFSALAWFRQSRVAT